ncbi:MAG: Hsp20/alpha crystallin family protein [Cyanobacteria bacterium REEB459]|nr:Hsp20/alpha crystallin family protein [Cyanobacteria bacterium REEB459]
MARVWWSPIWELELAAVQGQQNGVMTAVNPFGISDSGRLQVTSIEIQQTPEALLVTAFFPGVDPTTVEVQATQRSLTFLGHQPIPYLYGGAIRPFHQSLALPAAVWHRHIQVSYQTGGALVVTLPRQTGFWRRLTAMAGAWQEGMISHLNRRLNQVKKRLGQRLRRWSDRLLVGAYLDP